MAGCLARSRRRAVTNVCKQLQSLPKGVSHLVISVGGNDALECSPLLNSVQTDVVTILDELVEAQNRFRFEYTNLIQAVLRTGLSSAFCTIYSAVPDLRPVERMALSLFNDVIVCELARNHLPIVDLRMICTSARDYSQVSPIEPSEIRGFKIARALREVLTNHDFTRKESVIYPSATTARLL